MRFKDAGVEKQWRERRSELHPELLDVLDAMERLCALAGLPEPVLTSLIRPVDPKKFSWHEQGVACGADLRSYIYDGAGFDLVWAFLLFRAPRPRFECLYHAPTGNDWHFHLAYKAFDRRRAAQASSDAPPGGSTHG